jgi:hypothetical protein
METADTRKNNSKTSRKIILVRPAHNQYIFKNVMNLKICIVLQREATLCDHLGTERN